MWIPASPAQWARDVAQTESDAPLEVVDSKLLHLIHESFLEWNLAAASLVASDEEMEQLEAIYHTYKMAHTALSEWLEKGFR